MSDVPLQPRLRRALGEARLRKEGPGRGRSGTEQSNSHSLIERFVKRLTPPEKELAQ